MVKLIKTTVMAAALGLAFGGSAFAAMPKGSSESRKGPHRG